MGTAGKALKQVLETYGISQNQLAIPMGLGRSTINHWVNDKVKVHGVKRAQEKEESDQNEHSRQIQSRTQEYSGLAA